MKEQFIFHSNQEFPSCHAATICELDDGSFVSAWFAGTKEGASDTVILGSRKSRGQNWSEPEIWVDVPKRAAGNPRLFKGLDNSLWLIVPINYGQWCQGGSRLFIKKSYDKGNSWKDLELLCEKSGILGKNKPIYINSNVILIPVEDEISWDPGFLRSDDSGKTWELIMVSSNKKVIQPSVVNLSDNSLLAYARSWEGKIFQMVSQDYGLSWSKPEPTSLPNNNSGIDMTLLQSGNLVLVFNREGLGKGLRDNGETAWGPRNPLNIAISEDEGESWPHGKIIEKENQKNDYYEDLTNIEVPVIGEYSYPSIIQDSEGLINIVYTYERTGIKHIQISESEIIN